MLTFLVLVYPLIYRFSELGCFSEKYVLAVKPGLSGVKAATPLRAMQTRNHLFMAGKGEHRPVFHVSPQTSLLSLYLRLRLQKGLRRQLSTCSHHG